MKCTVVVTRAGRMEAVICSATADTMSKLGSHQTGHCLKTTVREQLYGQPTFSGFAGPMWNGDGLRYEDLTAYDQLSR